MKNFDIIIAGAGIVGLATAYKLIEKKPELKIPLTAVYSLAPNRSILNTTHRKPKIFIMGFA